MTKKLQRVIEDNNCAVYCVNTNNFYIKGDKLANQINIKSIGSGLFLVWSKDIKTSMTEEMIIALTA